MEFILAILLLMGSNMVVKKDTIDSIKDCHSVGKEYDGLKCVDKKTEGKQ